MVSHAPSPLLSFACHSGRTLDYLEGGLPALGADGYSAVRFERATKNQAGELIVYLTLNRAAQGTRPELRVKALLGDERDRFFGKLDLYVLSPDLSKDPRCPSKSSSPITGACSSTPSP